MKIDVLRLNYEGAKVITIENTNEGFNNALEWDDAWNTPTIRVNGKEYILICSDTGKMRHERISCVSKINLTNPQDTMQEPFMVGNIIITKFDGVDDFISLTEDDIINLMTRLYKHHNIYNTELMPSVLVID